MKVIRARNVNDALLLGLDLFQDPRNFREQQSRNGTTYEALEPVTTVYEKPWERVMLVKARDANPFFHFIEGLWMLAGRNDLKPLTYLVSSMKIFPMMAKLCGGLTVGDGEGIFIKTNLN